MVAEISNTASIRRIAYPNGKLHDLGAQLTKCRAQELIEDYTPGWAKRSDVEVAPARQTYASSEQSTESVRIFRERA